MYLTNTLGTTFCEVGRDATPENSYLSSVRPKMMLTDLPKNMHAERKWSVNSPEAPRVPTSGMTSG